jgi:serine/threonine protein kinase/Tol biopolymer transport system component
VNPPDRFAHVESLYHAARARTLAERAAFLEAACAGDVELRREVESLLAQPATGRGLLDTPAPGTDRRVSSFGTPILTGRQFGAYLIRASIGAGGMGEVYRARDTRLGRDVAIKILPTAFSSDPDRRARFDREARVLAALNHPHVGAIYGVEESDGIRAIVLELVDGETLAERIARGPIPVGEALTIARQITDAIDAAHEKGIVHRDLKPANIKVTPDGNVKVLDFGLATTASGDGSGPDLTRSPTVTRGGTREGMLLGTAAYMSPEQARGKASDKRTDVWAFGCVLYEMLTGRAAFAGDTFSDTIAAILGREPDWGRLPADIPAAVGLLLRRCLQRNPRDRLRDVADARFRLEELSGERVPPPSRAPMFSHRERLAWLTAIAVAIVALVAWTTWHSPEEVLEARVVIPTPPTWQPASLAISPDNRTLAFVATFEGKSLLWLRDLDNVIARVLPGTENAVYPFWSPDGRSIAFSVGTDLKRIDVESGEVQTVAPYISYFGGIWLEDDTMLVTPDHASPLVRVPASGGQPTPVTKTTALSLGHRFPSLLPDGRHFLYFAGDDDPGIHIGAFGEESSPKILDATAAVYAPSGHLLFVSEGSLYSQPFDVGRLKLTGSRTLIVHGVTPGPFGGSAALSVAANGSIFYRTGDPGSPRHLMWVGRNGKELETLPEFNQIGGHGVSLSPDDAFVAWTQGSEDLWLFDVERGMSTPFTFESGVDLRPVWEKPERRRVVYSSFRDGDFDLFMKSTGSGGGERLLPLPGDQYADDWSPDGRFILYTEGPARGGRQSPTQIWALPVDGTRTPVRVTRTERAAASGQFSPSGTWVAFHSNESNQFEVYIQPFPQGQKIPISTGGGMQPRWSHDGKELFYIGRDNQLMAVSVDVESANRPTIGIPRRLFTAHWSMDPHNPYVRNFSVSRDGRFLVDVLRETVSPVSVILNWKPKG